MAAKSFMSFRKTTVLTTWAQVGAGGGEDGLQVLQDAGRLFGDAACDKLPGGGIEGDLAGRVDEIAEADGLRIGADGAGCCGGGNGGFLCFGHVPILPGQARRLQIAARGGGSG